jgi:hypothetical protein
VQPWKGDNTTSVFITNKLKDTEVWALAEMHVEPTRGRALASGDWSSDEIERHDGLRLERDDDPPLHAAIVGWPREKDAMKALAMQLAANAKGVRLRQIQVPE